MTLSFLFASFIFWLLSQLTHSRDPVKNCLSSVEEQSWAWCRCSAHSLQEAKEPSSVSRKGTPTLWETEASECSCPSKLRASSENGQDGSPADAKPVSTHPRKRTSLREVSGTQASQYPESMKTSTGPTVSLQRLFILKEEVRMPFNHILNSCLDSYFGAGNNPL